MLRITKPLIVVFLASLSWASCHAGENAKPLPSYKAGKDYHVLETPMRTNNPDKIEVAEYFSYMCIHCYHFEPNIQAWKKDLAEDVELVYVPVVFSERMQPVAKIHYTAKQLGMLEELHEKFYTAIHVGKINLLDRGETEKFFETNGVEPETFNKTYDSFGVDSQVKQAISKTIGAMITGTPSLVVNGKYRVSSGQNALNVVDFLIEKERAQQK